VFSQAAGVDLSTGRLRSASFPSPGQTPATAAVYTTSTPPAPGTPFAAVASAVAANPVGAAGESVNLSNERVIYCPRYLQDNFANLMRMASDVDQVYYALLDLKNNGTRPPVLVLNSLIIAAGAHNRLDRAFAMIQEFEPVSS
jgi:hypothetical protein